MIIIYKTYFVLLSPQHAVFVTTTTTSSYYYEVTIESIFLVFFVDLDPTGGVAACPIYNADAFFSLLVFNHSIVSFRQTEDGDRRFLALENSAKRRNF